MLAEWRPARTSSGVFDAHLAWLANPHSPNWQGTRLLPATVLVRVQGGERNADIVQWQELLACTQSTRVRVPLSAPPPSSNGEDGPFVRGR